MLNMTIHVNQLMKCNISIKFDFQLQFVMFICSHTGTPIDPAAVLLSGRHCSTSHLPADTALRVTPEQTRVFANPRAREETMSDPAIPKKNSALFGPRRA